MTANRCADCGNRSTPDLPLVWSGSRLVHDVNWEGDGPFCPATPDDFGSCAKCDVVGPLSGMYRAALQVQFGEDGELDYGSQVHRPYAENPEGRWVRLEPGDGEAPHGTVGVVITHPYGGPAFLCDRCAADWPDEAKRPAARKANGGVAVRASAEEPKADKTDLQRKRAGLVPSSGPGLLMVDLASLWNLKRRQAVVVANELVAAGLLRSEEVDTGRGGSKPKRYWAVAP